MPNAFGKVLILTGGYISYHDKDLLFTAAKKFVDSRLIRDFEKWKWDEVIQAGVA